MNSLLPGNPEILHNLAISKISMQKKEEALKFAEITQSLCPDCEETQSIINFLKIKTDEKSSALVNLVSELTIKD